MCWFYMGIAQIALEPWKKVPQTILASPYAPGQRGKKVPQTILASLYPPPLRAMPTWKQHISKRGFPFQVQQKMLSNGENFYRKQHIPSHNQHRNLSSLTSLCSILKNCRNFTFQVISNNELPNANSNTNMNINMSININKTVSRQSSTTSKSSSKVVNSEHFHVRQLQVGISSFNKSVSEKVNYDRTRVLKIKRKKS